MHNRSTYTNQGCRCEICVEANTSYSKTRYYEDYKTQRARKNVAKYNINMEQYRLMLEEQGGLCAVCEQPNNLDRPLYIDHNHTTGEVRGLLCHRCNVALGMVSDNIEVLEKLIDYLKE